MKNNEELKDLIKERLKNKNIDFNNKTIEELIEELNIYYQELEFQNEELAKARFELELTKRYYEELFQKAPVAYVIYDTDFKIKNVNKKFLELLQLDTISQNSKITDFIAEEFQDNFYFYIRNLLKYKSDILSKDHFCNVENCMYSKDEIQLIDKNKNKIIVKMDSNIIESKDISIRTAFTDIRNEKEAQKIINSINEQLVIKNKELEEYKIRLDSAMLAGNIAWWEMDVTTGNVIFNENKTGMLGYDSKDFTHYTHFTSILHPDDYEKAMQAMRDHLEGKETLYKVEYRIKCKDGTYKWFEDIGRITKRGKDGNPLLVSGVVIDITDRVKAEKSKSIFLANMSHEIRTPINSIVGFANILKEENLTKEQKEYVNNIKISSDILLEIINDILDFSKIESGKFDLIESKVNLHKIIHDVYNILRNNAIQKHLEFFYEIKDNVPRIILADEIRIKQVLLNLLSNAIKFTEKGSVKFKVEFSPIMGKSDSGYFTFSVKDTGIGISKEDQAKLFRAFSQIEYSTSKRFGGTGLGLVISKTIVNKMGGKIDFESEPGKGSIFYFTIERKFFEEEKDIKEEDKKVITEISKGKYKILIAEDAEINFKLIEFLLKKIVPNSTIIKAINGNDAIKKYKEINPDIIFMDISMPEKDGFMATKEIREYERNLNKKETPIICLTANLITEEIIAKEYITAGFNDFLPKPFEIERLKEVLIRYLVRR